MEDLTRKERIAAHLRRNKKVYLGVGIGASTTVFCYVLTGNINKVTQIVIGKNNVVEQTTILVRRGHPGNVVRCRETGELFASQRRAAEMLNINKADLSKHLHGLKSTAGGYTFDNLGEAVA